MKPFCKYLLILFIVLAGKISSAQNMAAVNTMLSRQSMQMNMQMQMNMMNMMMLNRADFNFKHTFFATMKDGSRKEINSRILTDETTHKTYLLYVDKSLPKSDSNRNQKIYPDQTVSIERGLGVISNPRSAFQNTEPEKFFKGIAKDSCWMFKVVSGDINVYSFLSEETGQYFYEGTIVGIQLHDDGPIVKCTEENLKQMVGNDIDALENIQRKNYFKAIKKYNRNRRKEAEKAAAK